MVENDLSSPSGPLRKMSIEFPEVLEIHLLPFLSGSHFINFALVNRSIYQIIQKYISNSTLSRRVKKDADFIWYIYRPLLSNGQQHGWKIYVGSSNSTNNNFFIRCVQFINGVKHGRWGHKYLLGVNPVDKLTGTYTDGLYKLDTPLD